MGIAPLPSHECLFPTPSSPHSFLLCRLPHPATLWVRRANGRHTSPQSPVWVLSSGSWL